HARRDENLVSSRQHSPRKEGEDRGEGMAIPAADRGPCSARSSIVPSLTVAALFTLLASIPVATGAAACPPAWTRAPAPNGGDGVSLYGTTAIDASDAWAVGSYYDGRTDTALAEHWNGEQWSTIATPAVGRAAYLTDVAATSAD